MDSSTTTYVPFGERGGRLRGLLDLATGCYPAFLFGGPAGRLLPVFHLHENTPATLEPRFRYLVENGYRTVTSDAIARLVIDGVFPGDRVVVLCFDDALASLWTVAGPLLARYGLSAITFAIPGRIMDAPSVRPTLETGAIAPGSEDVSDTPCVTWPELAALSASGRVDVQSHTWSHARVFCASVVTGFVGPDFDDQLFLNRPTVRDGGRDRPLTARDLGAPLYPARSRMADARRFYDDEGSRARCMAHVAASGGVEFFNREGWEAALRAVARTGNGGDYETDEAVAAATEDELAAAATSSTPASASTSVTCVCRGGLAARSPAAPPSARATPLRSWTICSAGAPSPTATIPTV